MATQYIVDAIRQMQSQLAQIQATLDQIIADIPEDAEYAYIDNSEDDRNGD